MNKKAFTMLELVFVIVVLGILAALAIPRLDRDLQQEAADNVLSAIRYTQHLALLDDKHKFNKKKWQQRFWRIYFGTCDGKKFYAIGSDDDMESSANARVDFDESAIDAATGKRFWAHDGGCARGHQLTDLSPSVFIGKRYGVTTITPGGRCTNQYLGFDHLGRPYNSQFPNSQQPNNAGYLTAQCVFTFTMSDGATFKINIEPETGYAYIVGQPDS